jgi:hypothetical protein
MGTSYNPAIVTDGLVLCLDAANSRSYPKSGTAWSDLAESNNGTLTNGPTFDAGNGGSLVFDGTDDRVDLSTSFLDVSANQGFTISAWIKTTDSSGTIFFYNSSGVSDFFFTVDSNALQLQWTTYAGKSATSTTATGTSNIADGDWHLLVGTRDSTGVFRVYVDGVLEGTSSSSPQSGALSASGGSLCTDLASNCSLFYSHVRELSADEIRQNYEATAGRYS